jgi:formamidopyrimidine-DNA glycosylase
VIKTTAPVSAAPPFFKMPELPEVETIVRSLRNPADCAFTEGQSLRERPGIVGRQVAEARLNWAKTLALPDWQQFQQEVTGQTVQAVTRRGKFVVIPMGTGTLLFHLRMSGDLRVEPQDAAEQKHDRLLLDFSDGARLSFNDPRKFGRAWWVTDAQSVLGALGPEPLDEGLTGQQMYVRWHRSSRAIKTLLLDQSLLAGVGNIYSDEALFLARIHPLTPGNCLTPVQAEALLAGVRQVLHEGIERNGASIDWVYRGGDFQNYFRVYQRTGEPCTVCGTPIERRVIGQRSSHFCPHCQSFTGCS